jgi:hypothetical protein
MVRRVVGKPGSARELEKCLHANYSGIPIYHLLQARSLEVDVVQDRPCDDVGLRKFRHRFLLSVDTIKISVQTIDSMISTAQG